MRCPIAAELSPGARDRLGDQGIARLEVRIEAAVREPGLLHHIGDTDTGITVAPQRARGDLDDAVVGGFATSRLRGHGRTLAQNMIIIIILV
jgi:hypothetical protein